MRKSTFRPSAWQTGLFFEPESAVPEQRLRGGFITDYAYDWRKHRIPPKQIASASPLQFMILDAVDQALAEAGLSAEQFDRKQTAVVVGTVFGGDFSSQLVMGLRLPEFRRTLAETLRAHGVPGALVEQLSKSYAAVLLKHMPALVDETGSFTASALASRVTSVFDFMGGAFAVDASAASSLAALNCAVDLLLTRTVGMVACVGAQQDMTPNAFEAASLSGKLARGNGRAPFDAQARGTFPAEGCGVLLLKRLSEAREHGNRVFGIIRGVGGGTGPTHREAIGIAIRRAIDDAKARPAEVSFVETSGTGLAAPDVQEAQAVSESYGATGRRVPVLLSTVVGQIGHAGGASGMVSVLKASLALDEQKLPAVAGLVAPPPVVSQDARRLQLPAAECNLPLDDQQSRLLAGVTSCGELELVYHVVMERGTEMVQPLNKPAKNGDSLSHACQAARGTARIVEFDATARRREKMRQKGVQPAERQPAETVGKHRSNGSAAAEVGNAAQAGNAGPAATHFLPGEPPRAANLRAGLPVEAMSAPAFPSPPAAPPPIDVAELQLFLVNFVVEQTGYPPEIVSLDADLEADLGIDSIKKAQLFAEIGEHFQVAADAGLTLDQFATLRHVSDYLIERIGEPHAAVAVPAAAPSSSAVPMATAAAVAAIDAVELQLFLVNFVVEQTGYPPEIVSLDADLEADLGIDSIKKAQLFAEIGEHFQVAADTGLTLDQFATLRHVSDYLIERMGDPAISTTLPAADPSLSSVPVAAAVVAIDAGELQLFLVNFVVEQTGYPPEIVNLDADLEADLGIDSIKKAQLFAEIGEHFQVAADTGLTLDQFATLRHVSDYLIGRLSNVLSS